MGNHLSLSVAQGRGAVAEPLSLTLRKRLTEVLASP